MKKKKTKDRLEQLLIELSWYDPDEWNLTDEERDLLLEFYALQHRLTQLRGKSNNPGYKVGAVTFKERPRGLRVK